MAAEGKSDGGKRPRPASANALLGFVATATACLTWPKKRRAASTLGMLDALLN